MKKKPERFSFKKLTVLNKKNELKYLDELKNSYEKSIKSQSKNKSSDKIITAYETNNKFKIIKNGVERQRMRT
jgi:hypothetical protein